MIHPRGTPAGTARRSRRARARRPSVAGLWTGLLASPSLRVGRQGHDAWAEPVGQPTAVPPVLSPKMLADLQECRSGCDSARGPARRPTGRAQPVDTGVDPVRTHVHNPLSDLDTAGRGGAGAPEVPERPGVERNGEEGSAWPMPRWTWRP